jgi:hypothetical protein
VRTRHRDEVEDRLAAHEGPLWCFSLSSEDTVTSGARLHALVPRACLSKNRGVKPSYNNSLCMPSI